MAAAMRRCPLVGTSPKTRRCDPRRDGAAAAAGVWQHSAGAAPSGWQAWESGMGTEDWLRGGDPSTALSDVQEQVRKNPSNAKLRVFLFQLLAIEGRWDRALTQLKVAGELDAGHLAMVQTYREALSCEALRDEIFAGHRSPLIFGQPATWIALLAEPLRLSAAGEIEQSHKGRDEAFPAAPAPRGGTDDQPFESTADPDARLGT